MVSKKYLDIGEKQIKTTNVNILLNRVRKDQEKILRKKVFFSFVLICLISLLASYFIA